MKYKAFKIEANKFDNISLKKFKVFEKHKRESTANFFFQLSKEALECNFIDENMINEHIDKGNIRQDYWSKI